ncbi:CG14488, partial [Drosophila busckii]
TRANRMEQFLWQEIFAEYNRQNSMPEVWEPNQTEYFEEFCKDVPPEDADRKEVAINKHPLYCTTAITVWNPDGDATRTFKKIYSMTGPREQCSEKFAP